MPEKKIVRLQISEIVFAECNHGKVWIFCKDDVWEINLSLDQLQRELPAGLFFRVHRSFLVAVQQVLSYERGLVHLHGDFEVPVQDGRRHIFKSFLNPIKARVAPKKMLSG